MVETEGPETQKSSLAIYLVQGQCRIREILSPKIEKAREGLRREEKEKICQLRTGVGEAKAGSGLYTLYSQSSKNEQKNVRTS